jgi:hypothetical protein
MRSKVGLLGAGATLVMAVACSGDTSKEVASSGGASSGGASSGGASSGGASSGGASSGGASSGGASGAGGASTGGAAGTDAGASCQEGGLADAGAETIIAQSCVVAVVRVLRIDEECSGAGGAHVTFDVIALGKGTGVTRVRHGGHAYYAPPEGPDKLGEYFVAGIDPFGQLVPQPDNPGWCIVGLPPVDGYAHTFLEAASEADAKTKMAAILAK